MKTYNKNIFIILIGGIPGIGKSYLSNKITLEFKDLYEIKYLNFDLIENINKENYLQYQQMRNDYLLKIQEILQEINDFNFNKSLLIILDDNFFLKSMRKKIYNLIFDKIIEFQNNKSNIKFYYVELLLKPKDINYCLKKNLDRNNSQKIPDNIIVNMNKMFEYSSPYINKNQSIILDINNEESLNNSNKIKDIFNNKDKYIIQHKEKEEKEKIIVEKGNKAKLIDDIEDIIRKEVNIILKSNENNIKKGKEISIYKKEYMKMLLNDIKKKELNNNSNIDNDIENKSNTLKLLKDCIINNINNISQNENKMKIIKDDFINYLLEKKLITL